MPSYICLMNFTDQGAKTIKDTVQRAESARRMASEYGVTFKSVHWTQGAYDVVIELEAKDEAGFMAFGLIAASLGNTRTQTLRAFTADEMKAVISKLP
ncbi:MAG: GYD domain-containing protein [Paucibacter sp.]|nr:GYD domain-containing protein [Roseateles sp.]